MRAPSHPRPSSVFRYSPLVAALAGVLGVQDVLAVCSAGDIGTPYCVVNTAISGPGSFSDAVNYVNSNCFNNPNPVIEFNIPTGPFTISVPGGLSISCAAPVALNVTIDGTTQPGWTPNTTSAGFNGINPINLSGGNFTFGGLSFNGFSYGGSLTVKGIDFTDFTYGGCSLSSPVALSGAVNVYGSRFINNCTGLSANGIDPDGFGPALVGTATIGSSTVLADRNVFSGNIVDAIVISYGGHVDILGNLIGTDSTGAASGGAGGTGIHLPGATTVNIRNNVISGNGSAAYGGVFLSGANNITISGNKIGVGASGGSVPNAGAGIYSQFSSAVSITGNIIANNGGDGVLLPSASGNSIRGNQIYANTGRSINLGGGAQVPNDLDDPDTGANSLQNFPVINSVIQSGGNTTISWSLNSVLGSSYDIDFFSNPSVTVNAEGRTYLDPAGLGFAQASANLSTSTTFFGTTVIPGSQDHITATATNTSLGETSEYSAAALAVGAVLSPTSLSFGNVVVNSSSSPQSASITSVGSAPYQISYIGDSTFCYGGNPPCTGGAFVCSTTCATGTPYATGPACSFTATFAPITLGAQTTIIDICDNAGGNPRTLTLTGNAVVPPPATITPKLFDFGNVEAGALSALQTFTVNNPAPIAITLTPFAVTGPYIIASNSCGVTLAATASCAVDVKFAPTAVGATTGTLTSTASSGGVSASLAGTGTAGPPATLLPASVDFGAVTLGSTAGPATFTLTNPAVLPTSLSTFTVTPPFTLFGTTCGSSLAGGSSCTADVKFTPTGSGPVTGAIGIIAGGATYTAGLAGSGTALALLQITPSSFDFGSVLLGSASGTKAFDIFNPTTTTTSLAPISASTPFQLVSSTCGTSLAGLTSCSASVKFVPTAVGAASGALVATSSGGSASASLTGNGIRQPAVSLPTNPIEFGSLILGSAPVSQSITLRSTGNATLGINSISVGSPFTLTNGCGISLAAGDSCTVTVGFNPGAIGDFASFLSISTNAPGAAFIQIRTHAAVQAVPEPVVKVTPRTIGFGQRVADSPSPSQQVFISNEGGAIATLTLSIDVPHFTVQSTTCGATLAPLSSCTADLVFQPQGFGNKSGKLKVSSNAADSPQLVNLSGAGCRPVSVPQSRGTPPINCSP